MTEDELIDCYVEANPWHPGVAEARLKLGIPVWALIAHVHALKDPTLVAQDYDIPLDALRAALAYYHRHEAAIEGRIAANAA